MKNLKETFLQLLKHPDLVSLFAVVQDANVGLMAKSYTVWEVDYGMNLERDKRTTSFIFQSLWLYCGRKHAFPYDLDMNHADD